MARSSDAKSRIRVVPAAGAVLYRIDGDVPLCAVVHRPRYDDWSLPKGKVDAGESLPVTAVREIAEETGFNAVLGFRIGTTGYPLKENTRKEVTYWAAIAADGAFEPNSEVDELRWLPLDEAREQVTYALDRKILNRFADGPSADSSLLLVRHAKAGKRSEWSGDDSLRPLEKAGRSQAEFLAPMLEAFGVRRLHSAPRVRCEQTLVPLSDELDVQIASEPALSDEAYLNDPVAARTRLVELASTGGVPAVSSQGTAIPGLIGDLAELAGLRVENASTKKAGAWGLGFNDGVLVYADYYPSPLPVL